MWKDDNGKIEELYKEIKKIKIFPTICPVCKKRMRIFIYMFITVKQGEVVFGSGVVIAIHFFMAQPLYQIIGTIVHVWKLRNCALFQIIWMN